MLPRRIRRYLGPWTATNPPQTVQRIAKYADFGLGTLCAKHLGMAHRLWSVLLAATLSVSVLGACSCSSAPSKPAIAAPGKTAEVVTLSAAIDSVLAEEWAKASVVVAKPASDERFFRRVWLDIAGTLPSPDEVAAFVADTRPDKRAQAVDALLAGSHWPARFSSYWEDVLLGPIDKAALVDRAAFRAYLRERARQNAPWDQIVRELITATGKNTPGGKVRERRIAALSGAEEEQAEGVNGAVNWLISFGRSPENAAGHTARIFLGQQIQCAQCHDHKTESWKQSDFQAFAASYARTRARLSEDKEKGQMREVEVFDAEKPKPGRKATPEEKEIARTTPKALDGTPLAGENPRQALAAWVTNAKNPWFGKAIVNRMWSFFMGRGLVSPVDDLGTGNLPSLPRVLDLLADDFVSHGYDLRRLVRAICATSAYQRSPGTDNAEAAEAMFAAYRPRPLAGDVLFNAVFAATGAGPVVEDVMGERAPELRARLEQRFAFAFDVDERGEALDFEGTIPEALSMMNSPFFGVGSSAIEGAALARILALPGGDDNKIEAIWLQTLSRKPTTAEIATAKQILDEGEAAKEPASTAKPADPLGRKVRRVAKTPRDRAYEDLFWALLASSEFAFQH